jgi:hypothetical protein
MKRVLITLILVQLQILLANCQISQKDLPILKGSYLGQKPPELTLEIFAPGIVSTGMNTRDIAISKDGNEIFFCVADAKVTAIFVTRSINNQWTEPVIAPFSGKGYLDMEPCLSPDGNKIFFLSNRPPTGMEPKRGWFYQKIWVAERTETGWLEPQPLNSIINTDDHEFFPSVASSNTLYFTRMTRAGKSGIYKSAFVNNSYQTPELLFFDIPEKGILFNAFISPDENFLITCAQYIDSSNTDQDYYISYKQQSGGWGKLTRLGPEINTLSDNANSAYISPDGLYLFFSSSRRNSASLRIQSGTSLREILNASITPGHGVSSIYWVSTKIIEELRPKE